MKILLVDDSSTVRKQVVKLLMDANFEVMEAQNGSEGVKVWEQSGSAISLVISDYNMPEMDGIVMLRKIRKLPHGDKVAALMLTTESTPELKELGREVGLRAWVTKPYAPDKLIFAVKKILGVA